MTNPIMGAVKSTMNHLYEDYIYNIEVDANRACSLLSLLSSNYLEAATIDEDIALKAYFANSYDSIRSLVDIILDYACRVRAGTGNATKAMREIAEPRTEGKERE
jgi:hypothetical protein